MTSVPQRAHDRADLVMPIVVVHEGREMATESRNISPGGICVACADLPFGATVRVRIVVAGGPIELLATVRWLRDGVAGLQFASPGARETHALNALIKSARR